MNTLLLKRRVMNYLDLLKVNKNSLFYKLLKKLSILSFSFFIVFSVALTYIVGNQSSSDLEKIRTQENALRSQAQSLKFSKAVVDVQELKDLIVKELEKNEPQEYHVSEFDKEMSLLADGSTRSSKFENKAVGFISSHSEVNTDFKASFNKVFRVLNSTGATLKNQYYMVWAVFPNDSNIAYSKESPDTNLKISHDFSDTSQSYWSESTISKNPELKGKWLKPYFDPSFDKWMISYVTPIVINNNHVLTLGLDFSLKDLFQSLKLANEGKSYILSKTGEIIAHPDYMEEVIKTSGQFNIRSVENYDFKSLLEKDGHYKENGKNYFVSSIDYTDWKYVSAFPKFNLLSLAPVVFFWMIILGFLGFVLFGTLYYTINKHLIIPINQMSTSLDIKVDLFTPIQLKEEIIGEVSHIYGLYKKFLTILEDKNKSIEQDKLLRRFDVETATDKRVAAIKANLLKFELDKLSPEVFKKAEHMRNLSDRIFSKIPTELKESINPYYEEVNKTFKDIRTYEDKLTVLAENSDNVKVKMNSFEEMFGQVEDLFVKKFESLNIKYTSNYDRNIKMNVNHVLMVKALINIFDYSLKALESQKDGEKWIKLDTQFVEKNLELVISNSSEKTETPSLTLPVLADCKILMESMEFIDMNPYDENGVCKGFLFYIYAQEPSFLLVPSKKEKKVA
jgi:hypothetical protein